MPTSVNNIINSNNKITKVPEETFQHHLQWFWTQIHFSEHQTSSILSVLPETRQEKHKSDSVAYTANFLVYVNAGHFIP